MSFELGFAVAFITAGLVSFCVARVCEKPVFNFIRCIIQNETSSAFTKCVRYATYLVGISHGVTVSPLGTELMKHIVKPDSLHPEWRMWLAWTQTIIIQSLTAIASMYLVFFIFGLIAYITVKARVKWHLI